MQPQLFHISTAADSGTLLIAAVPMVLALPRGGAAMFTKSTPGCGTLNSPSFAWAASLWPKLRRSEGSPGPMPPNERGQQSCQDCQVTGMYMVYTWYIHGIYMIYITYILAVSETYLLCTFELLCRATMLCACISNSSNFHSFPVRVLKMGYALNIQGIYKVYVRYMWNHVALISLIIMLCWKGLNSTFDCLQPWHGLTKLKLQEIH